jgi:hypothetical protein
MRFFKEIRLRVMQSIIDMDIKLIHYELQVSKMANSYGRSRLTNKLYT